ncbi:MAG: hypothetical protein J0L56_13815 [Chitinophagales bacterium]|nr:hypothetical protein [Chitinophagales bacterium]
MNAKTNKGNPMRDMKSLLLVLLSTGLVFTWVYHLYDKTQYSKRRTEVYIKDSIAVAEAVKDSLQKIYAVTITDLDLKLDSASSNVNSLQTELGAKMAQIKNLRSEINAILGKRGVTKEELTLARLKISELQLLVDDLRSKNNSMEDEKKRLTGLMEQLNGNMSSLQQNMAKVDEENRALREKINLASVFVASELRLNAMAVKSGKEIETTQAKKAEKFVLSFLLQNNVNQYSNAEVYVIITGPDGEVLQSPVWESRTMDTKGEGKREYTLKIKFDYEKGEQKQMLFSLTPEHYKKGDYTMQVYHNGYRIGQVLKTLG